jgi:hypothetical protein
MTGIKEAFRNLWCLIWNESAVRPRTNHFQPLLKRLDKNGKPTRFHDIPYLVEEHSELETNICQEIR